MASLLIDGLTVNVEQGIEWLEDGTEEFDLGTFLIKNTTRRTPYPDYADVEITIGLSTVEACVKKDIVKRVKSGTIIKYEHTITIAEPIIKLSMYPHPDKLFTTKSGNKTTYDQQIEELIQSAFYGKTPTPTVNSSTLAFLNVEADEKEYSGGNLFISITDLMRDREAVPTYNLNNEIGHKDIRQLGNEIDFTRIDDEIITSDINDYAMKVYSKVKSATYEADLIAGGTYYPDRNTGVTPRSINEKYQSTEAIYILDSGIRRMIEVQGKNIDVNDPTLGVITLTDLQLIVVSKETWDDLETELDSQLVYQGQFKNNTPYFVEGSNEILNVGAEFPLFNKVPPSSDDVINQAIRRAVFLRYGSIAPFLFKTIKDIELTFYYQPQRDMDIVQERNDLSRVNKISAITNQQKDSKLELARFGNANKQLINRIGNDTFQITVRYLDKNNPTLFEVGDYTAEDYRIIKRQFALRNKSADITYLLTKNQSILNPTTSVKRNFVSPFTISKRNILSNYVYETYIEFSDTRKVDITTDTLQFRKTLLNAFDFNSADDTPIYNAQFLRGGTTDYINMSVMSVPMGSSFEFNAQFFHPKFAGYQLISDGNTGDKRNPVSYGDANGEVNTARVYFMNTSTINSDLHPLGTFNSNWYTRTPTSQTDLNPDEIYGITMAKHCVSDVEGFFIGDYFLRNNSLIKELGVAPTLSVAYYNNNPNYTIFDKELKSGFDGGGTITFDIVNYDNFLVNVPINTSWAIYRNNASTGVNELYFAYNYTGTDFRNVEINLIENRTNAITL